MLRPFARVWNDKMLGSVLSLHSGFPSASLPSNARIGLSLNLGKAVRKPWNLAYTLWLFTFSDLKTILFPTVSLVGYRSRVV